MASLLSLIYGNFKCSQTNDIILTVLFGLAMPTVMLIILYIPSLFNNGISPLIIDSQKGLVNFIFVYVLFSVSGVLLYLAPNNTLNKDATTVAPIS